jgi:hypothetical protein
MKPDPHKKKLYRKVNTKARGVHHDFGGDFNHIRNQKNESRELIKGSMHGSKNRGLDYTPLYKFLLSKVGADWDSVYSEAVSRLDRPDPIFLLVADDQEEGQDYVRVGESSYFSGLFIDENGLLQLVDPELKAADLEPFCTCCTHTLNGIPFGSNS